MGRLTVAGGKGGKKEKSKLSSRLWRFQTDDKEMNDNTCMQLSSVLSSRADNGSRRQKLWGEGLVGSSAHTRCCGKLRGRYREKNGQICLSVYLTDAMKPVQRREPTREERE